MDLNLGGGGEGGIGDVNLDEVRKSAESFVTRLFKESRESDSSDETGSYVEAEKKSKKLGDGGEDEAKVL